MRTTSHKTISTLLLMESWDVKALALHHQIEMMHCRIDRIRCIRYPFRSVAELLSHYNEL